MAVTITSITPSTGSSGGGTTVAIVGTGFTAGAQVTFGGVPATDFVFTDVQHISCKSPAHVAGSVRVQVAV